MKGKQLLSQIRWLDLEINQKMNELERLKSSMLKSPQLKQINVQERKVGFKDDVYVKMMEMNDYINERIDQLVELKREIIETIDSIDDGLERTILWMRFVDRKSWDEIESELACTRATMFRAYRQALRKFDTK